MNWKHWLVWGVLAVWSVGIGVYAHRGIVAEAEGYKGKEKESAWRETQMVRALEDSLTLYRAVSDSLAVRLNGCRAGHIGALRLYEATGSGAP